MYASTRCRQPLQIPTQAISMGLTTTQTHRQALLNCNSLRYWLTTSVLLNYAIIITSLMLFHNSCRTWAVLLCIVVVQLPLKVLFLALMSSGLGHTAFVGVIVICLFLVGACSAFCSLGLVAIACLLLLVVLLALLMLLGLTGCA